MGRSSLFPDAWSEGRDERLNQTWDLSYPLPVPRVPLACPTCGDYELMLKDWTFHMHVHSGSHQPWRCDVRMKCPGCAVVLSFGTPVTEDYYQAIPNLRTQRMGRYFSWRDGKQALDEAGYFDERTPT
jgi:hypothetical protein